MKSIHLIAYSASALTSTRPHSALTPRPDPFVVAAKFRSEDHGIKIVQAIQDIDVHDLASGTILIVSPASQLGLHLPLSVNSKLDARPVKNFAALDAN
jgi:hypothetical protein